MLKKLKVIFLIISLVLAILFIFNSYRIYKFSFSYSENESDAAIVLGAGTSNYAVSPIFKERLNHSIYLYNKNKVNYIILTGGNGKGKNISDSEIAKNYIMMSGIPEEVILIEKKSKFTIENLIESKKIMDANSLKTALIISDPLHMKRSIKLAEKININCKPSPTKTTMFKTKYPKLKSLCYETFYYTLGQIIGKNN